MTINERNLEKYVDNLLKLVAFKRKLIGCEYLKHAILLKCSCDNNRARLNKDIYPKVAEMFCTANTNVERAIRNAILDCHRNGCLIELNSIFGHPIVLQKSRDGKSLHSHLFWQGFLPQEAGKQFLYR